MIHLDGSYLEGGGQLVRNAVALSAITGQAVTIDAIRAKRKGKPGLKQSHSTAIQFLAKISGSQVIGGEVGSKRLTFVPGDQEESSSSTILPGYSIQQSTPGSIFLIFQTVYPYLLVRGAASLPITLTITGGTNVPRAPSYDYVEQVLIPNLERMGLPRIDMQLCRRGWTTGSNRLGEVKVSLHTSAESLDDHYYPSITILPRGQVTKIEATVLSPHACELAERTCSVLRQRLRDSETDIPIQTGRVETTSHHTHVYLLLVAYTSNGFRLGRDALGGREDEVVHRCIAGLMDELHVSESEDSWKPCVDEFMRDQLVVLEALDRRREREKLEGEERHWSLHTQTAKWVSEEFVHRT
ncbi:hypothetical protein ASPZODRAFT_130200 [Penicilliopsis zonata CBS 506.65]|uniref:RNA 3'-terminal phosphate cyclase domain-containing protein n=1 Tax=Penicilliopsis zonata CBS 506.65 TaxID=1073090 RepID=A0A1L9SMC4_9EURO|nr:hypothetical protein ASPZODRAFT_130200 [Penicilliopsis zonata CBS 506.65]OJJ48241.1 hypothetical protein ASPZODRAFT_130200 [Penicilliopsis zonata CBS 506.65]